MSDKMNFKIGKEISSENNVSILPPQKLDKPSKTFPTGIKFPLVRLVSVTAHEAFETKNGKTPAIAFLFKDSEKRTLNHMEFAIDTGDSKFDKKFNGLKERVKHIYVNTFGDFPEDGIIKNATNFEEFFQEVEEAFKSVKTEEGKSMLAKNRMFIKATYYNKRLGLPLYLNFVQMYQEGKPCLLEISGDDKIEKSTKSGSDIPTPPTGGGSDVPADFEEDFE